MSRLTAAAVLVGLVLGACAQPEADPVPGLDPELGVAPEVTEGEPSPVATSDPVTPESGSSPSAGTPEGGATGDDPASPSSPVPEASAPASPATAGQPAPSEPMVLLALADRAGDHGASGPAWTDLVALEFVEIANDLRVTLRFDGRLPATPPEGEVPLIGVDIGDDGYQLFVEGGGQSWAAYLDTPDGFVAYPGTFELAGAAMVLQVPFNELGSPTRAPVRAWVEWSRDSGLVGVLNETSEDRLDGEPHTFDRNP